MTLKTTRRRNRVAVTFVSGSRVICMTFDRETAADLIDAMEGRE